MTSFWRYNDVIITSCVQRVITCPCLNFNSGLEKWPLTWMNDYARFRLATSHHSATRKQNVLFVLFVARYFATFQYKPHRHPIFSGSQFVYQLIKIVVSVSSSPSQLPLISQPPSLPSSNYHGISRDLSFVGSSVYMCILLVRRGINGNTGMYGESNHIYRLHGVNRS